MFVITKHGNEIYNLDKYDRIMLLHDETIAVSRKGELYGLGRYDDAYPVFIDLCEAMGRGDIIYKMRGGDSVPTGHGIVETAKA